MTDDLIARLRVQYGNKHALEAADALEEITASREAVWKHAKTLERDLLAHKERISELEAALKPFAEMANYLDEPDDGETCGYAINCSDLRAARAALEKKND